MYSPTLRTKAAWLVESCISPSKPGQIHVLSIYSLAVPLNMALVCITQVRDPHLDKHLQHWGVNMAEMEKTEKTLAEMEIELNEKCVWFS